MADIFTFPRMYMYMYFSDILIAASPESQLYFLATNCKAGSVNNFYNTGLAQELKLCFHYKPRLMVWEGREKGRSNGAHHHLFTISAYGAVLLI